jgi:hypothetical protein
VPSSSSTNSLPPRALPARFRFPDHPQRPWRGAGVEFGNRPTIRSPA